MEGKNRAGEYSTHLTRAVRTSRERWRYEKSPLASRDAVHMLHEDYPTSDGGIASVRTVFAKKTHSQVDVTNPLSSATTASLSTPVHLVCNADDGPVPRTVSPRQRTNRRLLAELLRRMRTITTMPLALALSITKQTVQRLLRRVCSRRWWLRRRLCRFRQPPGIMDIYHQRLTE